jgi:hypothetical protein
MTNLKKEAKGKECQIRTLYCNHDPATTVLCHVHKPSLGGGMGLKVSDLLASHGCSSCHDLVDGRSGKPRTYKEQLQDTVDLYEGCFRTLNILIDEGKINF